MQQLGSEISLRWAAFTSPRGLRFIGTLRAAPNMGLFVLAMVAWSYRLKPDYSGNLFQLTGAGSPQLCIALL